MNTAKLKTNDATYHGKKIDAVVDALRAAAIAPGRGYKLRKTPLGTVLDIEPTQGGAESTHPFKATFAGISEDETSALIRITPGIICEGLEPVTIDGYNAENLLFAVPLTLTRWIYLKVHLDASGIADGAEILCESSVPTAEPGESSTGAPPPYTYRAVAKVINDTTNTPEITNYLTGSQWVSVVVSEWGCGHIVRNAVWTE